MKTLAPALLIALSTLTLPAGAQAAGEVVRHGNPASNFPISQAVEVPAGMTTVYLSGQIPTLSNPQYPKDNPLAYGGDLRGQTLNVLSAIEKTLKRLGLGMGDVVKMQVFLVKGPAGGEAIDFAGFMDGYRQFFGTSAQPALPARSAFQIAGLNNPAHLLEIEVIAVRK